MQAGCGVAESLHSVRRRQIFQGREGIKLPHDLGTDMERNSLLLADDEKLVLHSFSKVLASESLGVTLAATGEEAVFLINNGHFDIIVTDLVMPGLDGFQVLKAAKKGRTDNGYHFDRLWRYGILCRCAAVGSR